MPKRKKDFADKILAGEIKAKTEEKKVKKNLSEMTAEEKANYYYKRYCAANKRIKRLKEENKSLREIINNNEEKLSDLLD